jgi:uncharacterized membrane protein YfcA
MIEMFKNKRNARIIGMILGLIMGIGMGSALDNIALGIGMGVAYGVALGRAFSGQELIKDKKTRRRFSWAMLGFSMLGCLAFGYIAGNITLGITAGIGFSFVIGLKWEKLYDERMSSMFSKAARNAFVTINAGLSIVLIFIQGMEDPLINLPLGELLQYVIYLSWAVFLISWFYHANYKGE